MSEQIRDSDAVARHRAGDEIPHSNKSEWE
jgi:hypothetical protein